MFRLCTVPGVIKQNLIFDAIDNSVVKQMKMKNKEILWRIYGQIQVNLPRVLFTYNVWPLKNRVTAFETECTTLENSMQTTIRIR